MTPEQIIVLATPVFLLLIALEYGLGRRRGLRLYAYGDALNSIGLGMLSQLSGLFMKFLILGIYTLAWQQLAPWQLAADSPAVWLAGLLVYDLSYYALHRAGHRVAIFWAAHVVHHQSEEYNLSTALRQTSSGSLLGGLFYLPMALLGFPPLVFAVVGLVDLLYQFWVHTRLVGRLGWFDRWFCSPSNHRIHHAVNDACLDRNYGGILMVWDRLFGSYLDEDPSLALVYGTRKPLRSWNPLWANLEVYAQLWHDCRHARRWTDRLRVWFMPPGWRPADVAARYPLPAFDIRRLPYQPPVGPAAQAGAAALFLAALAVTAGLLWQAHQLSIWQQAAGSAAVLGLLALTGRLCGDGLWPASLRRAVRQG